MAGAVGRWRRRHDPEWFSLYRAIKILIVVMVGMAVGTFVVRDAQFSTFAAFGGFAMLMFADFPGGRTARLSAYLGLVAIGVPLIVLGTLLSSIPWAAVASMTIVGFLILLSGVLSAAAAGASRAALLAFILPVSATSTPDEIPLRLAGWGFAALLAVPLAVFAWAPKDHDELRPRAADATAALAARLRSLDSTDTDQASTTAIEALRSTFRSSNSRPVGLGTGARVLMRLPDRLEWLRAVTTRMPADASGWPEHSREVLARSADVLDAGAVLLRDRRPSVANRDALRRAMHELEEERARAMDFERVLADGASADSSPDRLGRPAAVHEVAYTTRLVGETLETSANADSRSLVDRLIGRRAPETAHGPVRAARVLLADHITWRSVWFQNSVRGGVGLGLAVLIVELTDVGHSFWVILGTLSVLRTTALNTGSNALRALAGTAVGFLVGTGLVLLLGTTQWHLWLLLPVLLLVAGYVPTAISFAAGQAGFTLLVLILFNIIQPTGWTVGVVRIENVALGCLAGLVTGFLLWPRGAAAQIRRSLAEVYRRTTAALSVATRRLVDGTPSEADYRAALLAAEAASVRVDDAVREYLFERGSKGMDLDELIAVANGAGRIKLAGQAVAAMAEVHARREGVAALRSAGKELLSTDAASWAWFERLAEVIQRRAGELSDPSVPDTERRVLDEFRTAPASVEAADTVDRARDVWRASLFLDDVTRLETRLSASVVALRESAGAAR